jgi:hypothetical protein
MRVRLFAPLVVLGSVASVAPLAVFVSACGTEDPTMVVADNLYAPPDGGDRSKEISVFKVWWVTSMMPDPVAPGGEGEAERTVPSTDFAYAVLAVGWDPSIATAPTRLIPARSSVKLTAARGDTLHVDISDATFLGNCAAGKPLSQDDAELITTRIFPGEFEGVAYDAATCTASALPPDGGTEAGTSDAGAAEATAPDGGTD